MKRFAGLMVAVFGLFLVWPAGAAEYDSPEGVWELEFRDSHFRVEYCDGENLCGTLIWLSESSSTPEKVKYLNQLIVKHARPAGENKWRGEMDLLGEHVNGTIEQVSNDRLALTGCKFVVFCRTYMMYRMEPGASPADSVD